MSLFDTQLFDSTCSLKTESGNCPKPVKVLFLCFLEVIFDFINTSGMIEDGNVLRDEMIQLYVQLNSLNNFIIMRFSKYVHKWIVLFFKVINNECNSNKNRRI